VRTSTVTPLSVYDVIVAWAPATGPSVRPGSRSSHVTRAASARPSATESRMARGVLVTRYSPITVARGSHCGISKT